MSFKAAKKGGSNMSKPVSVQIRVKSADRWFLPDPFQVESTEHSSHHVDSLPGRCLFLQFQNPHISREGVKLTSCGNRPNHIFIPQRSNSDTGRMRKNRELPLTCQSHVYDILCPNPLFNISVQGICFMKVRRWMNFKSF